MYKAIIKFYWRLLWTQLLPNWLFQTRPDPKHFHRRRFTPQYRSKQRLVLNLWGGVATIIIFVPVFPIVVFICMLALFLSLAILDETT